VARKHAKDTKRVNGSASVYTMRDGRYRATATVCIHGGGSAAVVIDGAASSV
jgi:nitrite reductase/ring-hydroxylating ferredoxin subunit